MTSMFFIQVYTSALLHNCGNKYIVVLKIAVTQYFYLERNSRLPLTCFL